MITVEQAKEKMDGVVVPLATLFKDDPKENNSNFFKEIEKDILQSEGMKEICLAFKKINNLDDGQRVDVHQMRVITYDEEFGDKTPVAPEGVHQDGFDCIAMVGINRNNIKNN